MYSGGLPDIISYIMLIVIFIAIVSFCCGSDTSSSGTTSAKRNTSSPKRQTNTHYNNSYRECPACGAPYYNGLCEECGYPDINQGWLGEN